MFLRVMSYLRAFWQAIRMPFVLLPWSLMILKEPSRIINHFWWCVENEKGMEPLRRQLAEYGQGYGYFSSRKK